MSTTPTKGKMPTALHLHDLPPELLRLILTSFDSLPDLYSFIQASPECFRIYRIAPEFILSSVLRNAIHPDALHHALAVTLVDPEESIVMGEDEEHWQFLDSYFQRDSTLFKFPTSMPSSVEAVLSAMGIARYWPLRRLGYVFWDIERVRDPEVNERLRNARDCDPNVAKKAFEEFIQESAETRLKGMKLPRTLMEEIKNDYTVMFAEPILETDSESDMLDSEDDFA
ncbi:hypothetical protein Trisim1_002547 [Trichoderma cf. simile WF8]